MPNKDEMFTEMYASIKVVESKVGDMHEKLHDIPERVTKLESDAKWYKRIFTVVYSAVGAGVVMFVNWLKG